MGYYVVAHASKFVPTDSIRVNSTSVGGNEDFNSLVSHVAFSTPDKGTVLLIQNTLSSEEVTTNVFFEEQWFTVTLPALSISTFNW